MAPQQVGSVDLDEKNRHKIGTSTKSPWPYEGFRPIADYGIIGNCHTAALVSSEGSIDWLCLPRFDSPSLFARILDPERGGFWSIRPASKFTSDHKYVNETNVLQTDFHSQRGKLVLYDFMDIGSDRRSISGPAPGRLVRIVECMEGALDVTCQCAPRPNYAKNMPDLVPNNKDVIIDQFVLTGPRDWDIDGKKGFLSSTITLHAGEKASFTLATREDVAHSRFSPLQAQATTMDFWRNVSARCTYQGPYRDEVIRSALTLKLMTYPPTGAIVAAPTTSLPETLGGERNWDYRFTWIRDASFTLYALLLSGYLDDYHPFFHWIINNVKQLGTGIRILYPITPDGETAEQTLDHLRGYCDSRPVRIGNMADGQVQFDIYGEVIGAIHFAWRVGKYDPTEIWPQVQGMLDWVADHWHEPDNGIWEVRGGLRNFVYSKAMLWFALSLGIEMAEFLDLPGDIERWRHEVGTIKEEIMDKGWSDELGAFKQSYEDEVIDASNLLLPMIGFIDGKDPKMVSTIDATMRELVVDGLCYRYTSAPEGVAGKEGHFVLCTFWLADALIQAGRFDEAKRMCDGILTKASPLGLFAEELDPSTGMHLGNFPQAFSHIGLINVAVSFALQGYMGKVLPNDAMAAEAAGHGGGG